MNSVVTEHILITCIACAIGKSLKINSIQLIYFQYNYQAHNFLSEIISNREHGMRVVELPKIDYGAKRGLINLVGRVANVLFGVCDDSDALYFYKKIKELEILNSQLTDTQTQKMQSLIYNVNSSSLEIEKSKIKLADKYNYLLQEAQIEKVELGNLNFKTAQRNEYYY